MNDLSRHKGMACLHHRSNDIPEHWPTVLFDYLANDVPQLRVTINAVTQVGSEVAISCNETPGWMSQLAGSAIEPRPPHAVWKCRMTAPGDILKSPLNPHRILGEVKTIITIIEFLVIHSEPGGKELRSWVMYPHPWE